LPGGVRRRVPRSDGAWAARGRERRRRPPRPRGRRRDGPARAAARLSGPARGARAAARGRRAPRPARRRGARAGGVAFLVGRRYGRAAGRIRLSNVVTTARYAGSPMATASADELSHFDPGRVTVITARRGWAPLDLRELWDYRELLYHLVWRD